MLEKYNGRSFRKYTTKCIKNVMCMQLAFISKFKRSPHELYVRAKVERVIQMETLVILKSEPNLNALTICLVKD